MCLAADKLPAIISRCIDVVWFLNPALAGSRFDNVVVTISVGRVMS